MRNEAIIDRLNRQRAGSPSSSEGGDYSDEGNHSGDSGDHLGDDKYFAKRQGSNPHRNQGPGPVGSIHGNWLPNAQPKQVGSPPPSSSRSVVSGKSRFIPRYPAPVLGNELVTRPRSNVGGHGSMASGVSRHNPRRLVPIFGDEIVRRPPSNGGYSDFAPPVSGYDDASRQGGTSDGLPLRPARRLPPLTEMSRRSVSLSQTVSDESTLISVIVKPSFVLLALSPAPLILAEHTVSLVSFLCRGWHPVKRSNPEVSPGMMIRAENWGTRRDIEKRDEASKGMIGFTWTT
jgi:hypothetical protein